jgi:hypothetical protein
VEGVAWVLTQTMPMGGGNRDTGPVLKGLQAALEMPDRMPAGLDTWRLLGFFGPLCHKGSKGTPSRVFLKRSMPRACHTKAVFIESFGSRGHGVGFGLAARWTNLARAHNTLASRLCVL